MDQRDICGLNELEAICRNALRETEGFGSIEKVVVMLRAGELVEGTANWMIGHIVPRPPNAVLRAARPVIEDLQRSYSLAA